MHFMRICVLLVACPAARYNEHMLFSTFLCISLTVGRPSRYQNNHDLIWVVGHCPGRSFVVSPAVESC